MKKGEKGAYKRGKTEFHGRVVRTKERKRGRRGGREKHHVLLSCLPQAEIDCKIHRMEYEEEACGAAARRTNALEVLYKHLDYPRKVKKQSEGVNKGKVFHFQKVKANPKGPSEI